MLHVRTLQCNRRRLFIVKPVYAQKHIMSKLQDFGRQNSAAPDKLRKLAAAGASGQYTSNIERDVLRQLTGHVCWLHCTYIGHVMRCPATYVGMPRSPCDLLQYQYMPLSTATLWWKQGVDRSVMIIMIPLFKPQTP